MRCALTMSTAGRLAAGRQAGRQVRVACWLAVWVRFQGRPHQLWQNKQDRQGVLISNNITVLNDFEVFRVTKATLAG